MHFLPILKLEACLVNVPMPHVRPKLLPSPTRCKTKQTHFVTNVEKYDFIVKSPPLPTSDPVMTAFATHKDVLEQEQRGSSTLCDNAVDSVAVCMLRVSKFYKDKCAVRNVSLVRSFSN